MALRPFATESTSHARDLIDDFFDDDFLYPARSWYRTPYDIVERPFNRRSRDLRDFDRDRWSMLPGDARFTDNAFDVDLDIRGYRPEELNVKVEKNMLEVDGKHEERSDDGTRYVSRQFARRYSMPNNVNLDGIKSSLTNNGRVLKIHAPLQQASIEAPRSTEVPVQIVK